jgi:hypothetical protein
MSGLTLFTWPADKKYANPQSHEVRLVPQAGDEVFIYFAATGAKEDNAIDKSNINKIMKKFGYTKNLKINNLANSQTKAISKGELGTFNAERIKEIDKIFEELAKMFLIYLHRMVWSDYNDTAKKYVLSTIYVDEAYTKLEKGVSDFEKVLTECIADKFNINIVKAEMFNANERHDLENDQMINFKRKGKK